MGYVALRLLLGVWVEQPALNVLSVLPVFLIAWFWGMRYAILFAFLILPAHSLIFFITNPAAGWQLLPQERFDQIGFVLLIVFGMIIGRIRNLQWALERELKHRLAVEESLRYTETKYRTLVEQVPAAIYIDEIDDNGVSTTTYMSPQFETMLGYSVAEVKADPDFWPTLLHTEDRQAALAQDNRHYVTGEPLAQEYRMVAKNGRIVWIRDEAVTLHDEQMNLYSQGILRDITERKHAEDALKASEARFRLVFELSQIGLAIAALNGRYQQVNQALCNMLEYPKHELIGKSFADVTHPEDIETNNRLTQDLLAGTIPHFQIQKRYLTKTQQTIIVILQVMLVNDEAGTPLHFLAEVVNITEREKARLALLEQEAYIRQLYQITSHISQDIEEQINHALTVARRMLGLDIAIISYINNDVYTILYFDPPEANLHRGQTFPLGDTYCSITLQTNGVVEIPHTNQSPYRQHPCYTIFQLEAYLGVPLQVHGKPYGTLNFSSPHARSEPFRPVDHDFITLLANWMGAAIERKLAEDALQETQIALIQARDKAIAADHTKSELLANVSHELRTPLGVILGNAEILQEGIYGSLTEKQQKAVFRILTSTNFLTTQVNDLLDMSRLEAGKLQLKLENFSPADLLNQIQTQMHILAESKNLNFTTQIDPGVPQTVLGDSLRIKQILFNLITNAIKFTEVGQVQVKVSKPSETYWSIQVSDTGLGISTEAQQFVFEPFRQVDGSTTRIHKGVGLGLAIVKQLTNLMGGQIMLQSQMGQGSTFTVQLPLSPVFPASAELYKEANI